MTENTRSPADVRAYLEQHRLEVVELPADTSTATSAAEALNTTVDTIVKSLLFVVGDEPVLVLAAGDRMVETGELADIVTSPGCSGLRCQFHLQSQGLATPPDRQCHSLAWIVIGNDLLERVGVG
jgi:hypothetical protein